LPSASHRVAAAGRTQRTATGDHASRNPPDGPPQSGCNPTGRSPGFRNIEEGLDAAGRLPTPAAQWHVFRRIPGRVTSRDFLSPLRGQRRFLTCFPFHSAPGSTGAEHLQGHRCRHAAGRFRTLSHGRSADTTPSGWGWQATARTADDGLRPLRPCTVPGAGRSSPASSAMSRLPGRDCPGHARRLHGG
jgi:hypothetical protein